MVTLDVSAGDPLDQHLDGDLSGQTIEIPPGTYTRGGEWITTLDGTTIKCTDPTGEVVVEGEENAHRLEWNCTGSSTVRDLTFKGVRPEGGNGQNMQNAAVTDASATLTFLNVRWPDGSVSPSDTHGMYVRPEHDGAVKYRYCEMNSFGDNGLYASSMGASGGAVEVEKSIFYHNNIAAIRMGGSGSYVRDSYIEVDAGSVPAGLQGTNARGVWSRKDGDYTIENCDFVYNSPDSPIYTLSGDTSGGTTTVRDCRFRQNGTGILIWTDDQHTIEGSGNHATGTSTDTHAEHVFECRGDSCDSPSPPPEYDPSGDGDDGGGDDGTNGGDPPEWTPANAILIASSEDFSNLTYSFTVSGRVTREASAEPTDVITDNGDGTWTVEGTIGNGYADEFSTDGDLLDWSVPEGAVIRWNGEEPGQQQAGGDGLFLGLGVLAAAALEHRRRQR